MATVNTKHYYFKISEYGRITDVYEKDFSGMSCDKIRDIQKKTWCKNFKLYPETKEILQEAEDPESDFFPLYRSIGKYPEDYEFNSMKDALREYESQIGEEIYCYTHDC